jgi:hypothetical protein
MTKLNRAVFGLDSHVYLRLQEVARLLVDHLNQQTINKQTKFTASNLMSPHILTAGITAIIISPRRYNPSTKHPPHVHFIHLSSFTQHKRYKSSHSQNTLYQQQ